jgi:multiple sugar transport system permease protein
VPTELDEVGDGGRLQLPSPCSPAFCSHAVRPGLITIGLFAFLASWNDFIGPLILNSSPDKDTAAGGGGEHAAAGLRQHRLRRAGGRASRCSRSLVWSCFMILQRGYVQGFMSGSHARMNCQLD